MKLKELADLANEIPEVKFDWAGPEQYHSEVFKNEIERYGILPYLEKLRERMADYAIALHTYGEAFNKLREIVFDMKVKTKK
jgi:hypothetical protein